MKSRSNSIEVPLSPPPNRETTTTSTITTPVVSRSLSMRPLSHANSHPPSNVKASDKSPPPHGGRGTATPTPPARSHTPVIDMTNIVRAPTPKRLPNKISHEAFFGAKAGPTDSAEILDSRWTVNPVLETKTFADGSTTVVTTGFTPSKPRASVKLAAVGLLDDEDEVSEKLVVESTPTMTMGRRSQGGLARPSSAGHAFQCTPVFPAAPAPSPVEIVATPGGTSAAPVEGAGLFASLTRMWSPSQRTSKGTSPDATPLSTPLHIFATIMDGEEDAVPPPVTSRSDQDNITLRRGESNKENVPGSPIQAALTCTAGALGAFVSFVCSSVGSTKSDAEKENIIQAATVLPVDQSSVDNSPRYSPVLPSTEHNSGGEKRTPLGELPKVTSLESVIIPMGDVSTSTYGHSSFNTTDATLEQGPTPPEENGETSPSATPQQDNNESAGRLSRSHRPSYTTPTLNGALNSSIALQETPTTTSSGLDAKHVRNNLTIKTDFGDDNLQQPLQEVMPLPTLPDSGIQLGESPTSPKQEALVNSNLFKIHDPQYFAMHNLLTLPPPEKKRVVTIARLTDFLVFAGVEFNPKAKRSQLLSDVKRVLIAKRNRDDDDGDDYYHSQTSSPAPSMETSAPSDLAPVLTSAPEKNDNVPAVATSLAKLTIKKLLKFCKKENIDVPTPLPKKHHLVAIANAHLAASGGTV